MHILMWFEYGLSSLKHVEALLLRDSLLADRSGMRQVFPTQGRTLVNVVRTVIPIGGLVLTLSCLGVA